MKEKVVKKPWGGFKRFTLNEPTTVKIIAVLPKQRFSLQYHHDRSEFWRFLDNPAKVTIGKKTFTVKKGDEFIVHRGQPHRVQALAKPVSFLEVSFGHFDENDITRIEDDYGRAKSKNTKAKSTKIKSKAKPSKKKSKSTSAKKKAKTTKKKRR